MSENRAPAQPELPFAVVQGQPYTQLPQDLYIPPDALEVILEAFEGPLDLLLYLIRRQNLDILDIPIAEITRQYVEYIELMQDLQFELAADYLVMAAILAEIKSRMLLPRPAVDETGEEIDPRAELVRRLQEYERFKKAAAEIEELPRLERDIRVVSALAEKIGPVAAPPSVELDEILAAFRDVMVRADMYATHAVTMEPLSVRERMSRTLEQLRTTPYLEFGRLFKPEEGRLGVVVTLLALLELVREHLIDLVQNEPLGNLYVKSLAA